jgi:hypothetical protein
MLPELGEGHNLANELVDKALSLSTDVADRYLKIVSA